MIPDRPGRRPPPDPDVADDIEILEVVGIDEDGLPLAEGDPDDVEVVFEDGAPAEESVAASAASTPTVEDAKLHDRLMRLQADFENFKKRIDRERLDHFRYATAALVGRILPVLDNFERAMASARNGTADGALLEGVALIQRQLVQELEAEGLRAMESVGEPFDPALHEAVATDSDSPMPPHTVTQVFQRGYFLHERVIRPAMVRVRVDASEDGGVGEREES